MAWTSSALPTMSIPMSSSSNPIKNTLPPSTFHNKPVQAPPATTTLNKYTSRKSLRNHTRTCVVKASKLALSPNQLQDRIQFDETKDGVKGLVGSGISSIPYFFVHPQETQTKYKVAADQAKLYTDLVPIIDFSGVESPGRRETLVEQIAKVSRDVGLFQLINHGIPLELMENTISTMRAFHEQPVELKAPFYHRDMSRGASYYSNVDLLDCEAASWGDTLRVMGPPRPEVIPEICRDEVVESHKQIKRLAELLLDMLCDGLGVDAGKMRQLTSLEAWTIVGLYYPPCPQPDLTVGQLAHTDPGFFTVLMQDHVGGLQVKYRDQWVDVKPIPGALVVNIGDIFQIMSNGAYVSADHRVLANRSNQARVSTAFFFRPSNKESVYGPFGELISPETPPLYREFTLTDFIYRFVTQSFDGKANILSYYKID